MGRGGHLLLSPHAVNSTQGSADRRREWYIILSRGSRQKAGRALDASDLRDASRNLRNHQETHHVNVSSQVCRPPNPARQRCVRYYFAEHVYDGSLDRPLRLRAMNFNAIQEPVYSAPALAAALSVLILALVALNAFCRRLRQAAELTATCFYCSQTVTDGEFVHIAMYESEASNRNPTSFRRRRLQCRPFFVDWRSSGHQRCRLALQDLH
ncbi:hypothetical protein BCR44DRAFT_1051871 [Catenaria anguillulae PL171]|uniref:Uncharacterized protein n=1 Tax=Catenaria anguillulae PL171 TaxID=765915 RepID=A0A1Y2HV87_9FUNG|nr:hypothetical protein BCR44DRAFT_1051871 [Catenaria anguillulae PL171]